MDDRSAPRLAVALPERFFCDGPYYVITSASLGGSVTAEALADTLSRGDEQGIERLLAEGACLPLFFPGDCAFDSAIVVVGDLTEQEESEWIGRIRSKLNVPDGKLLILCGGGEADFTRGAMTGKGVNGYTSYFTTIDVPPGNYLLEVYAYVSSMTVDFYFEDDEPLEEWWQRTRPGQQWPEWLRVFKAERAIGELSDRLVSCLLRLSPLTTEPPLPKLDDELGWCMEFDFRRPERCPLGIPRSATLGG